MRAIPRWMDWGTRAGRGVAGLCLLASATLCACASDDDEARPARDPFSWPTPVPVGDQLLLIDPARDTGYLVGVGRDPIDVDSVRLGPGIRSAHARAGQHSQALVLSSGLRGVDAEATLTIVDGDGVQATHALQSPFDALVQSPEGGYAVAYHRHAPDAVVFSPNVMALMDLQRDRTTHVTLKTPGAPHDVVVSPAMRVAGKRRNFLVALSDNHLGVVDLSDLEAPAQLSVQLGADTPEGRVMPVQVAFDVEGAHLYVRCEDSDDVFVVSLIEAPEDRTADVWAEVTPIAAGPMPSDVAVMVLQSGPRALVTSAQQADIRLLSATTLASDGVPMPRDHDRVLAYELDDGQGQALLYRAGDDVVSFVDGAGLVDDPGAHTRSVRLSAAVEDVRRFGAAHAIVQHSPGQYGLVDLEQQRVLPFGTPLTSARLLAHPDMDVLWVLGAAQPLVGFMHAGSGQSGEVLLDAAVVDGALVPEAGKVLFLHADATVSVLDATMPSASDIRTVALP